MITKQHWLYGIFIALVLHFSVFALMLRPEPLQQNAMPEMGVEISLGLLGDVTPPMANETQDIIEEPIKPIEKTTPIEQSKAVDVIEKKLPEKVDSVVKVAVEDTVITEVKIKPKQKPKPQQVKKPKEPVKPKPTVKKMPVEAEPIKPASKPMTQKSNEQHPASSTMASGALTAKATMQKQGSQAQSDANGANQAPLKMDKTTQRYLAKLMRHLNGYKVYPASLKKNGIEGKPVIRFSINQRGQVILAEVKKGSGNSALDQAALDVFAHANPVPPLPKSMKRTTLTLALPIAYSLINQ